MDVVLITMMGGAVCGAVAGFLVALFIWWGQDLRDARLAAAQIPLP